MECINVISVLNENQFEWKIDINNFLKDNLIAIIAVSINCIYTAPIQQKKKSFHNFYKQKILSNSRIEYTIIMASTEDIALKYLGSTYRLGKKIDEGAFGKIYKGSKIKGSNQEYAVKIESLRAQHPQLISQCRLYNMLHTDPYALNKGIPYMFACGVEDEYNYLVMELMGPSLESLLNKYNKKFSLKTVLMILDQMILRIQYLHSRNLLHRDIKPDNFCMGLNQSKQKLYIIDFGLAKKYLLPNGRHIPYKEGKSLTGTARYASVNTHRGIEQACRDDMESIGYVALYCLKGSLPWQGQKGGNKNDKYQRIKETKINTPIQVLCKGCPQEFAKYLYIVRRLQFEQRPNYNELRNIFKDLFAKHGYHLDYEFDWSKPKESKLEAAQMRVFK